MSDQLTQFLTEEKKKEMDKTKSTLDELRRTRRARGGTGAPLEIPRHLRAVDSNAIIITDNDMPYIKKG